MEAAAQIPATPVDENCTTDLVTVHTLARMFCLLIYDTKKKHPELDFFDVIEALAIAGTTLLYEQSVMTQQPILTDQQFRYIADHIGRKLAKTMDELSVTSAMELIGMTTFLATMAHGHGQQFREFSRELEKRMAQISADEQGIVE